MSIKEQTKTKMEAAIEHLRNDLKGIRTGRANTAMLDNIFVEIYGSPTRIRDIASITTPEPRQLMISPFDRQNTSAIGKAIEKANLGFMPIVEANLIRIKIPPMDEAMRKEMVKQCHKRREDAKVVIRNIRRDGNDALKKQKSAGEIAEDVVNKVEKEIQKLTDDFCKEADKVTEQKEKEVTTI